MRRLKIYVIPKLKYFPSAINALEMPFTIFTSRNATVGDVHKKLCESLQSKSKKSDKTLTELCGWSRLWKIDSSTESAEDINNRVYATEGKSENLPVEIRGEVLPSNLVID
jgi:hypothetical protein